MTCPRCRGLMFSEQDRHGAYATCLTCGYVSEAEPPAEWVPAESKIGHRGGGRRKSLRSVVRLG